MCRPWITPTASPGNQQVTITSREQEHRPWATDLKAWNILDKHVDIFFHWGSSKHQILRYETLIITYGQATLFNIYREQTSLGNPWIFKYIYVRLPKWTRSFMLCFTRGLNGMASESSSTWSLLGTYHTLKTEHGRTYHDPPGSPTSASGGTW